MTTTSDEERRLLLLAAVASTRPAGPDGYVLSRLVALGYTRDQALAAAAALVAAAGEVAALTRPVLMEARR